MKPGNDPDNVGPARSPLEQKDQDRLAGEKTSPYIGLSLSSTKLETFPGAPTETSLKIRNLSTIVDRFRLKVEGLDPTWWTFSVPTFASFPGDQGESKLTVRPPKEAEAMAGSYSFRVKAISEANPQEETVVPALLVLRGFVAWEVEMSPTKVQGSSGTYQVTARNSGNNDAVLSFEGKDAEEALAYSFSRDRISVSPGAEARVQLTVHPKKGNQPKTHYFQVTTLHAGAQKDARALNGQLDYVPRPKYPWWLVPVVVAGVGVVLIGLGVGAGLYQASESRLFGLYSSSSTPFRAFMVPLIAAGVVLVGVGVVMGRRRYNRR